MIAIAVGSIRQTGPAMQNTACGQPVRERWPVSTQAPYPGRHRDITDAGILPGHLNGVGHADSSAWVRMENVVL